MPQDIKKTQAPGLSKPEFSALKLAFELGYIIVIPLVILALLGRFLDKRFGSSPWLLLCGIFLSMIISCFGIYKTVAPILKSFEEKGKKVKKKKDKKT